MSAKDTPQRPPPYGCIVCGARLPEGRQQGRCASCAIPVRRGKGWFIEPPAERPE